MRKAANTLLIVASGLVLFSSMAFAKSAAKDSSKDEHHSKMAKVAFWRHHKTDNNTKQAPAHKAVTKSQPKAKATSAKVTPAKASESHPKVMPAKQTAKPKQAVKSQQSKTEHKESQKAKTAKPAAKEKE